MAGNRVEELEAKVRELKATIDGLTDELVETKERLHALEADADPQPDIIEGRISRESADAAGGTDAEKPGDEESADEVNTDEAEGSDESESESDDIIVA